MIAQVTATARRVACATVNFATGLGMRAHHGLAKTG